MALKVPKFVPQDLILKALGFSVVGGLFAYVYSMVMAPLLANTAFSAVYYFLLFVAMAYIAKAVTIDNVHWFQMAMLLLAMAGIGSIITWIRPDAAQFILGAGEPTIPGFMHTLFYMMFAELIMKKVK